MGLLGLPSRVKAQATEIVVHFGWRLVAVHRAHLKPGQNIRSIGIRPMATRIRAMARSRRRRSGQKPMPRVRLTPATHHL
jgi:hypothetical protein